MVYLFTLILFIEVIIIYYFKRDILSPAVVFVAMFFISALNVASNAKKIGLYLDEFTVIFIILGTFLLTAGTEVVPKIRSKKLLPAVNIIMDSQVVFRSTDRELSLKNYKLIALSLFNIFTSVYIVKQVYAKTLSFGFSGTLLESLGRYRELGAIYDVGLGVLPTLLTALAESNGYVMGSVIAKKMVMKQKITFLMWLVFLTSFVSTFSQGSRGGLYMLISSAFIYILQYQKTKGNIYLRIKVIIKILAICGIALEAFKISGDLVGKTWDIPFYEYLSVYLGDPLFNFNTVLKEKISRSPLVGYISFGSIYNHIFRKVGIVMPQYSVGGFRFFHGHNLGNVYTIFPILIADFGYFGAQVMLFITGILSQTLYKWAKNINKEISVIEIFFAYMLCSLAFSIFSNKFYENISFYHGYTMIFQYFFALLLTKNGHIKEYYNVVYN